MNITRTHLYILISSVALCTVLIIQVNWLVETAKIKEALFNEKANIVLARTSDALAADTATCQKLEAGVGQEEIHKIDSLFKYYMKFYDFTIQYSFEVMEKKTVAKSEAYAFNPQPNEPACFQLNLEDVVSRNGWELKLILPEKKQYIYEEMGPLFVTSILLLLIVLFLFWKTLLSLNRQKKLSEHTNDFLNNMTHEFKTPISNIALAGKFMLKEEITHQQEKVRHYSEIILEENEKLRLQVEQVLSLAALERDEIPIHKTEVDLHQIINDAIKNLKIQLEHKQGTIHIQFDAKNSRLKGDKTHLTHVICNLIDNAIKYSESSPVIHIDTINQDHHLIITITDQGIGIEKEFQKKVFDKYFRVPTGNVHNVQGFGLGLAYIKKIIELHKGTIALESEKGKGTKFIINFPANES
ncbi:MAG: HAMP domain-containing histidine kinase [Bacteroidetes bacterium]|nr:HAMP domain-containing histidine kinase [Bacteroidota bacterium]